MASLPAPLLERSGDARRRRSSDADAPLLGERGEARAQGGRRSREWNIIPTGAVARRNFGMVLLGIVVFAWVSSNFLTHAIFSDDTYSKPYFITFLNTSMFCLYLLPTAVRECMSRRGAKDAESCERNVESPAVLEDEEGGGGGEVQERITGSDGLTTRETIRLSAEFCLVWFFANYFNSYCLKFTSVSSATILSSTAAMFTLILGSLLGVETFTSTKVLSVLASLIGIYLISTTDLNPPSVSESASRTPLQILLGDGMALLSAFSYAIYITLLKVRIGDESRVNMQVFFGFVGLFNVVLLWPGLLVLHYTGVEPFEMPPEGRVWAIVMVNASITLTSDFCWAYAMLLTTPLVVTVGLSLTIPLALLGQMVLLGSVAGGWYWVGAGFVFVAFWFLSRES